MRRGAALWVITALLGCNDAANFKGQTQQQAQSADASQTGSGGPSKDPASGTGDSSKQNPNGITTPTTEGTTPTGGTPNSVQDPNQIADQTPGNNSLIGDPDKTIIVGKSPIALTDPTKDQKDTIKECLAHWGLLHPFALGRQKADKIILGNLELGPANRLIDGLLGTGLSGITDTTVTAKPSLILILASVNILASDFVLPPVTYKLYNPNGWYCIHFSFDIGSTLRVELKKGAHLAESHFNLDVLSNTAPIAQDNISILSKSTVITVP